MTLLREHRFPGSAYVVHCFTQSTILDAVYR